MQTSFLFFLSLSVFSVFGLATESVREIPLGETFLTTSSHIEHLPVGSVCSVNSVQIQVFGGQAQIDQLSVRFANGETQILPVRKTFQNGEASRWIDLDWTQRCIHSLQISGKALGNSSSGPVTVRFLARQFENPLQQLPLGFFNQINPQGSNLVLLPKLCGIANIKLIVIQGSFDINRLTAHYGNGDSEVLSVRRQWTQGQESRWIDLDGSTRCLERLELKGQSSGDGSPILIEVQGLIGRSFLFSTRHVVMPLNG